MQIRDIFQKDISRPINGVVKADQLDESVIWQELEEYVITRELDKHLRKFLSVYLAGIDAPNDPTITSRMGVWVSGFFGSGKSHFIKILSYLLANRKTIYPYTGEEKDAITFFKEKVTDSMMMGDLQRIAKMDTDVILFNIDSRADASDGRTSLLAVFWRVFNEYLGYCSQSLHLAEIERYLDKKGKYEAFKEKFQEIYGSPWEDERDAYSLLQDEITEALSSVLDKSKDAAAQWFEKSEQDLIVSVENFARRVKEYLDAQSPTQRIVFLVDEIGQFIGNDTHLMLNLQTLVEDIGRICNGRAWILVTSQEDVDAVLGNIKSSKANDFSKIQGRFNTRLSLSGANVDEVIRARLLAKNEAAVPELERLYEEKGDILKNQLSFTYDSSTLKNYESADDFVDNYPFIPYQHRLVQKIFESIRKAGATGLHLAMGERSMLDAFQSAASNISDQSTGALVPLHEFYPCIESFLDTSVKRSIDQAKDNAGLDIQFDINILQALFLIRYVDLLKPNIENLVTLCISEVDADRIELKQKIEGALERLEKETLINRNGDLYFFLTNEEREVSREIKNVEIAATSETQLLGDIIFEDILKGKTKHKYADYNRDYPLNRICDDKYWGKPLDNELGIEILSPLHDEYEFFIPAKCNLYSANHDTNLIVKVDADKSMTDEIRLYLQVNKYIQDKSDATASSSLKQILRDRADENRERKNRLIEKVDGLLTNAEFYALGKKLDIDAASTNKAINDGLDYLVKNIFSKFGYLSYVASDPIKEIRQILMSDDVAQHQLTLDLNEQEPPDIREVMAYITDKTAINHPIILNELVSHFAKRPYGWGEFQTVILVAKLFMAQRLSLVVEGSKVKPKDAIAPLSKTAQWKTVKIVKTSPPDKKEIEKAKSLAKELFTKMPPESPEKLGECIRDGLAEWEKRFEKFKTLADTGSYPGKPEIDASLGIIQSLTKIHDAFERIKAFNERKDDLLDTSEDLDQLSDFYNNQRPTWDKLKEALTRFKPNQSQLEKDPDAAKALKRMMEIADAPNPYPMIKEIEGLIAKVETVNNALIERNKEKATEDVDARISQLTELLDKHNADGDFRNKTLYPIQQIKKKIQKEYSIPQIITYDVSESQEAYEEALNKIEEKVKPPDDPGPKKPKKETRVVKPSAYNSKLYLDTEEEADEFVNKLRESIVGAIKDNYRVKIQ